MKKIFYTLLFVNVFIFGQQNTGNRFSQSENQNDNLGENTSAAKKDVYAKPGNPADTNLPINQYTTFLLLVGFGAVVLISKKQGATLLKNSH